MKETESNTPLLPLMVILTTVLVVLAGLNVIRMQQNRRSARDAVHNALWLQINKQLSAREATGEFPASLEELAPTDQDRGASDLLKLIDYRREGTGCRVSTTLRGQKLEKEYGPREAERPPEQRVENK